jgi:hypothetical protein
LRLFQKCSYGGIQRCWIEERLISLDIHENIAFNVRRDLGDPFGACAMIDPGHAGLAAKAGHDFEDAFVIGGDDDAAYPLCQFGTFVHALDHRLSRQ